MKQFDIKIGIGLNDLRFGATRAEVRGVLGPPTDVHEESHPGSECETWSYEWGSASFAPEHGYRLDTLQVEDPSATLLGVRPIGLDELGLWSALRTLRSANLGTAEREDLAIKENPSKVLLAFPNQELNFWFSGGRVEAVQWGCLFADDDTVQWP